MSQALSAGTLHWVKPTLAAQHETLAASHGGGGASRSASPARMAAPSPIAAPPSPPAPPLSPSPAAVRHDEAAPGAAPTWREVAPSAAAAEGVGELPLVYVDVAVSASVTERVPVWSHTDCEAAAVAVAKRHGLPTRLAGKLAGLLRRQQEQAMAHGSGVVGVVGGAGVGGGLRN